jgi:hypothetical protein
VATDGAVATGGASTGWAGLGGPALNLEVASRAIVVLRGAKPGGK